jgi:hypothetical protein
VRIRRSCEEKRDEEGGGIFGRKITKCMGTYAVYLSALANRNHVKRKGMKRGVKFVREGYIRERYEFAGVLPPRFPVMPAG